MTVDSIWWPSLAARDLHLLPGLVSPRLDHLLAIGDTAGNAVRADAPPAGVGVAFAARLTPALTSLGLRVDAGTGEIEVDLPLPAPSAAAPRVRSYRAVRQ